MKRLAMYLAAAAAGGLLLAATAGAAPAPSADSIDWPAVSKAMGRTLAVESHGVHAVEFPRFDLKIRAEGVRLSPHMELLAEANFKAVREGKALMMGEATLTNAEVQPFTDALEHGGILVTALHKHLRAETPRLWWLHYEAYGKPVQIAKALHAALEKTHIPLKARPKKTYKHTQLDAAALEKIMHAKGDFEGPVLTFHVPVARPMWNSWAGIVLPPEMEASSLVMFQPIGPGKAVVNGDITMQAHQVNPVIRALHAHGIEFVSVHNHLLFEQPRHFYMHFWATGNAEKLAGGLRAALDAARP